MQRIRQMTLPRDLLSLPNSAASGIYSPNHRPPASTRPGEGFETGILERYERMKSRAAELGSLLRDAFADPPGSRGARGQVGRRLDGAMPVLLGAVALGAALATRPGDPLFYLASVILALIWLGGGLASGPMRLGRMPSPPHRRPWAAGLA